jgi:hypothetical protein
MNNNHGLRTTGRPTGNFGRAKVQGKRDSLDISPTILQKESLSIPPREKAFAKLEEAFELATDPKVKQTLWEMIRARKVSQSKPKVTASIIRSPYWEETKLYR